MSVKKNLTVAALAALLTVPAFAMNAKAADVNFGDDVNPISKLAWNGHSFGDFSHNGHYFNVIQHNAGGTVTGYDGDNGVSNIDVANALGGGQYAQYIKEMHEYTGNSSDNSNSADGYANNSGVTNTSSSDSSSSSSQSSSELPQTGESSNKGIMALGATALMASASLAALSMSKKRKEMALEETNTDDAKVSADDGKDGAPHYSTKSNYDMIMSKTFNSIGNGLKNL